LKVFDTLLTLLGKIIQLHENESGISIEVIR